MFFLASACFCGCGLEVERRGQEGGVGAWKGCGERGARYLGHYVRLKQASVDVSVVAPGSGDLFHWLSPPFIPLAGDVSTTLGVGRTALGVGRTALGVGMRGPRFGERGGGAGHCCTSCFSSR